MHQSITIGMDLGSYKTAVMTSEGRRAVIPTIVGRPKDGISRKLLNADSVFGDAVMQHRHSLQIIRPLANGSLKCVVPSSDDTPEHSLIAQRESLERIVEHAFTLVGVERGSAAAAIIGVPALASIESKELIIAVAEHVCRSVMVVSEPFAVAYGMDRLTDTLVIDIGAGTTDICAMTGVFPPPEHQHTLRIGGDAVDSELVKLVLTQHPSAICSPDILREAKERFGSITEDLTQADLTVVVNGKPEILNIAKQLRQACRMLVDPIFQGIKECLGIWDSETQDRLLRRVILAGGGSRIVGLDAVLERMLREFYGTACVSRVYDSMFAGAAGALKLAIEMPEKYWAMSKKAA